MSSPKSPSTSALPPEPPELAAERERLIPELLKQAKTATGVTQTVLRKLHDVLQQTRPGASENVQVYSEAKAAFELFGKEPNLKPPPIIAEVITFLQKRAAAMGATGQPKPASSPPAPAPAASGPPRGAPSPRRSTLDGFEMPIRRTSSAVNLNPAVAAPAAANQGKPAPASGAPPQQLKPPGPGKVKG
jgi:hypothetical protein